MESSKIGYQDWLYAFYLVITNLKGVSSMKLHRDLGITQKSAWHLAHRIRKLWESGKEGPFAGPVEVDETYMGGKRRNMPKSKRSGLEGRGPDWQDGCGRCQGPGNQKGSGQGGRKYH